MDIEDHDHFKTIAAASSKLPISSSTKPEPANSPSGLDPDYLLTRARLLFACYRRDDANDPETYCAAVAAVLGDGYSRAVVEYVTDPRTGIASRIKFLPSIAEIREACAAQAAFVERLDRYAGLRPVAPREVPVRKGEITYGQYLKNCEASGRNKRPIGRFEG